MASVVCISLFAPLYATNISVEELKLQKANVVRISRRRITARATGLLALCSFSKDVFLRSRGRSTSPLGCSSELVPCCMNVGSSSNKIITGFWVGPDIDDGWGFVEASVNQVTLL
ncbi:hypothetical protein LINGRAHAP2_LOCUS28426 [Linum grandiflorum]